MLAIVMGHRVPDSDSDSDMTFALFGVSVFRFFGFSVFANCFIVSINAFQFFNFSMF